MFQIERFTLQYLDITLVKPCSLIDGFCHFLAFLCRLFQLACKFNANLIGFPILLHNRIDHIDHLV